MHTTIWRLLAAATLSIPVLSACGNRDSYMINDSAGGTMVMSDSAGMGGQGTMNEMSNGMTTDASFVSFVAMVNQAEIEAGQLANAKARNADVKKYARELVDVHQKAMEEFRELGAGNRMGNGMGNGMGTDMMAGTMTQMQRSHQSAMQSLRSASGASFDATYMSSQVATHQQVLDVLRQHNASVQNSELRTKMTDMQTNVEAHLRRAQEIAQKIGTTS